MKYAVTYILGDGVPRILIVEARDSEDARDAATDVLVRQKHRGIIITKVEAIE